MFTSPVQSSQSPWKVKFVHTKICHKKWGGLGRPISGGHKPTSDKLIKPSFESTDKLETTLGVKTSNDMPFLYCEVHCDKSNKIQAKCASNIIQSQAKRKVVQICAKTKIELKLRKEQKEKKGVRTEKEWHLTLLSTCFTGHQIHWRQFKWVTT